MGRQLGRYAPFWEGVAGSPSNTVAWAEAYLRTKWHLNPSSHLIWAENWGLCSLGGGGAGSPSNTMWPGPRPTCTPSFILIHPAVWPQYTNVTDRTGGQTVRQTDRIKRQDRKRSDSIARNVFGRPFVKRFALCYRPLSDLYVCDVGVLWLNGWMDQDATWYEGRPLPRPHCVRWGRSYPT